MAVKVNKYNISEIVLANEIIIDSEDIKEVGLTNKELTLVIPFNKAKKYIDIEKLEEDL
jgi:hypothetical protein